MPPDQHDVPLPIVTPRLTLNLPKPGDGAALASAIEETWEALFPWFHRHLGPKDQETDPRRKEDFVARSIADAAARRRLLLLGFDRFDGDFVVWSGFPNIDWRERRFEIDYWVRRSKQGRGFAQEAVNACLNYAFAVMGARVVTLGCAATNEASLAVARRLGFTHRLASPMDMSCRMVARSTGVSTSARDRSICPRSTCLGTAKPLSSARRKSASGQNGVYRSR